MLPCLLLHQFHCQMWGSSLNRAIVLLVSLDSNQPSIPSSIDAENGRMPMVDLHFSQHVPGESLSHAYDLPWIPRGSHEQALQVTHVPPHYGIEHFGISKWWKKAECHHQENTRTMDLKWFKFKLSWKARVSRYLNHPRQGFNQGKLARGISKQQTGEGVWDLDHARRFGCWFQNCSMRWAPFEIRTLMTNI